MHICRERIIKYLKLKLPNLRVKKFISIEKDKNKIIFCNYHLTHCQIFITGNKR